MQEHPDLPGMPLPKKKRSRNILSLTLFHRLNERIYSLPALCNKTCLAGCNVVVLYYM